jgi:hypothetical protein
VSIAEAATHTVKRDLFIVRPRFLNLGGGAEDQGGTIGELILGRTPMLLKPGDENQEQ